MKYSIQKVELIGRNKRDIRTALDKMKYYIQNVGLFKNLFCRKDSNYEFV